MIDPRISDVVPVAAPPAVPERIQGRRKRPVELGRDRPRVRALGLRRVDDDDLGLIAERGAEAEPEVHRHADDQREVCSLEPRAARAGEEDLVVGGHASARQAVEEHRDSQLLGGSSRAPSPRPQ